MSDIRIATPEDQILLEKEAKYCSYGDTVHYIEPPRIFSRCEGSYVWDTEDQAYLDLQMWYSAVNFGYSNPRLNNALKQQIDTLPQLASQYLHKEKVELATIICRAIKKSWNAGGRVHFNVGGSQAVEDSLKLVRNACKGKSLMIAFEGGYRHFGLEGRCVVTARSSHCFLLLLVGDFRRPLKQKYHLSGCPISRSHSSPRLAIQVGRYAHAKQFRRMKATLKSLRTLVGRVWRDIDRKLDRNDETTAVRAEAILARVKRVLTQQPKDKNKLYSLHAPEVECISKGKARQPYEFGVKVTVATTHKEGLVVGMRSMPGNPYDGHTLPEAVEQVSILTDHLPKAVFVDKGYRGVDVPGVTIWRSGQKRGVTSAIKKAIHRRSAVEPAIGHMKNDGRLRRNWLKGSLGDALHAVLCGAGHNLRMILRALRLYFTFLLVGPWGSNLRCRPRNQNSYRLFPA